MKKVPKSAPSDYLHDRPSCGMFKNHFSVTPVCLFLPFQQGWSYAQRKLIFRDSIQKSVNLLKQEKVLF